MLFRDIFAFPIMEKSVLDVIDLFTGKPHATFGVPELYVVLLFAASAESR